MATEDLVYAFTEMDVVTGIDLDRLIDVSNWLGRQVGHKLPGRVARAGGLPAAPELVKQTVE